MGSTSSGTAPTAIVRRNVSSASIDLRNRPSAPVGILVAPKWARSSFGYGSDRFPRLASSASATANSIAERRSRCSISIRSDMSRG